MSAFPAPDTGIGVRTRSRARAQALSEAQVAFEMPTSSASETIEAGARARSRTSTSTTQQQDSTSAASEAAPPEHDKSSKTRSSRPRTRKPRTVIVRWHSPPPESTLSNETGDVTNSTAGAESVTKKKKKKKPRKKSIHSPEAATSQANQQSAQDALNNGLSSASGSGGKSLLRRSQEKFEEMKCSTPIKIPDAPDGTVKKEKEIMAAELQVITEFSKKFLRTLYDPDIPSGPIKTFLSTTPLYDDKRKCWVTIPPVAEREEDMYDPFLEVIKSILANLVIPNEGAKSTREAFDTHKTSFPHHDGAKTRPDIAIVATGPSFEDPLPADLDLTNSGGETTRLVGYSNVASVFDLKRNKDNSRVEQIKQLAVYAKQIFLSQPNRRFVRALIITEDKVRLLHYDRSGAYITDMINFHDEAETFVRLVVALSSHIEEHVGLDSSIQWTVDDNNRKVAGTICVRDDRSPDATPDTFYLDMKEPPLVHETIRGTGTTCWVARDSDGNRIHVKDSWIASERMPEHELLEQAEFDEVEGVVTEIEAYEDGTAQTKQYRPKLFKSTNFFNRNFCRVALKVPGPPLSKFTSQLEAITALRDGIKGHRNLLTAGILHRDICMNSIIIVKNDKGQMGGKLWDLTLAIHCDEKAELSPDSRTGSRLYLSSAVLRNSKEEKQLAPVVHDYLDDLEAFNYVLADLLHSYKGVGIAMPPQAANDLIPIWQNSAGQAASQSKLHFMEEGPVDWIISPFWSNPSIELCRNLGMYLHGLAKEKATIRRIRGGELSAGERARKFSSLYDDIDKHYSVVIGHFDAAVVQLAAPGGQNPRKAFVHSPRTAEGQRCHNAPEDDSDSSSSEDDNHPSEDQSAGDGEGGTDNQSLEATPRISNETFCDILRGTTAQLAPHESDLEPDNDLPQSPSPLARARPRSKRALGDVDNEDEPATKRHRATNHTNTVGPGLA